MQIISKTLCMEISHWLDRIWRYETFLCNDRLIETLKINQKHFLFELERYIKRRRVDKR